MVRGGKKLRILPRSPVHRVVHSGRTRLATNSAVVALIVASRQQPEEQTVLRYRSAYYSSTIRRLLLLFCHVIQGNLTTSIR
jgi:hypothetical protein